MRKSLAVLAFVGPLIVGLGTACGSSSPASMSAPITSAIPDSPSPLVLPPLDSSTATTSTPSGEGLAYYANCSAVRAASAAPLYQGQSGYRPELDRDGDGVACEVGNTSPALPAAPPGGSPGGSPGGPPDEAPYYRNCDAARAAGVAPLHSGDPGYRSGLDRDGDGIACE